MLLKCEGGVVDQRIEENNNLDILEMIANPIEPLMKLINRGLLIFKCYQVDVEDIKCSLQWWEKHENMFLVLGLCAK